MKERILKIALGISYFGDYCSMMGLMEFAKSFGGSDKVIAVTIGYFIPPLLMALFARNWANTKVKVKHQFFIAAMLGALCSVSLLFATSFAHVFLAAVTLGLIKAVLMTLMKLFIKREISEERAGKVLNHLVTIRYIVMVFGGTFGASVANAGYPNVVFGLDALSFLCAAALIMSLREESTVQEEKADEDKTHPLALSRLRGMVATYGMVPLAWTLAAFIALGSFVGLEYALFTNELGINPRYIGIAWIGHLVGSIVGGRYGNKLVERTQLSGVVTGISFLKLVGLSLVGVFGGNLGVIAIQMACLAVVQMLCESISGAHLMKQTTQEEFKHYNISFSVFLQTALFVGSAIPLVLAKSFSLLSINIGLCVAMITVGVAALTVQAALGPKVLERGVL